MALNAPWRLGFAALLAGTAASAQTTLGQLVDAGAEPLSPEAFRQRVVQRAVVGPFAGGMNLEVVYTPRGSVEGTGAPTSRVTNAPDWAVGVRGAWRFGDDGTVCTAIVLDGPLIRANFPSRCQLWYRLGDRYYVADSGADRGARVLPRAVKE
jgi:hypothetical protein